MATSQRCATSAATTARGRDRPGIAGIAAPRRARAVSREPLDSASCVCGCLCAVCLSWGCLAHLAPRASLGSSGRALRAVGCGVDCRGRLLHRLYSCTSRPCCALLVLLGCISRLAYTTARRLACYTTAPRLACLLRCVCSERCVLVGRLAATPYVGTTSRRTSLALRSPLSLTANSARSLTVSVYLKV